MDKRPFNGRKVVDLTGQTFGELRVTRLVKVQRHGALWECRCSCGKKAIARSGNLRSGNTQSCGCQEGQRTHGQAGIYSRANRTKTYMAWARAKTRYGTTEPWDAFEEFYRAIGPKPSKETGCVCMTLISPWAQRMRCGR
jgi:hypothetical protein